MELQEAITRRHSVRRYTDRAIGAEVRQPLQQTIDDCNRESGLHMQLCLNEPHAFDSRMAHYGKLINVKNYLAIVGEKGKDFQESCGYYGEKVVLRVTQLGLGSCWVAMSYSKQKGKQAVTLNKGERLAIVVALGYGETNGVPRKTKPLEQLCRVEGEIPEWFRKGMEAVQLAPTAVNQQRFLFELKGNRVAATALPGFYTKIDLGIAKCHFEIGAGDGDWSWA